MGGGRAAVFGNFLGHSQQRFQGVWTQLIQGGRFRVDVAEGLRSGLLQDSGPALIRPDVKSKDESAALPEP